MTDDGNSARELRVGSDLVGELATSVIKSASGFTLGFTPPSP